MKKKEVVAPGVAEGVNHALKKNIPVYEVTETEIERFREEKLEGGKAWDEDVNIQDESTKPLAEELEY